MKKQTTDSITRQLPDKSFCIIEHGFYALVGLPDIERLLKGEHRKFVGGKAAVAAD